MRPLVITVFDAEAGTTTNHSFTTSPVRIGRNPLNDLTLPFAFVSGWHAIVRFDDETARFFDLGSTNGTLLDGRRVQAGEPVTIVDVVAVTVGRLELRFSRPVDVASAPAPGPTPMVPQFQPTAAFQAVGAPTANAPVGPRASAGTIDPAHMRAAPVASAAGTAHVPMSEVHQSIAGLRPLFDAYRAAWYQLATAIHHGTAGMDPGTRHFTLTVMQRELPGIARESQFEEMAAAAGVAVSPTPGEAGRGEDVGAIGRLSDALRPGEEPPRSPQECARFLKCVEDVLKASAKAFVELQKGQEQFGNEMGVRTIKEFTPLHAAATADNVLKYLLDWQSGGPHRTQELVGVYADLMIHQVALINGVMEGARGLLARLDPGELERSVTSSWPTRAAALWKHFMQRHRELLDDDRRLTEAIFGSEFARAYAEVGGEGSGRRS